MKVLNERGDEMDHIDVTKYPEDCDEDLPNEVISEARLMKEELNLQRMIKLESDAHIKQINENR
jgi:hypothetical protein